MGSKEARHLRPLLLLAVLAASSCVTPPFDYRSHRAPRVSVVHEPLYPRPGTDVTVTATAEVAPGDAVRSIEIDYFGSGGAVEQTCPGPATTCTLVVPASLGPSGEPSLGIYGARLRTMRGAIGRPPSSYIFQIGRPADSSDAIALRVPFDLYRDPLRSRAFSILLVADATSYPGGGTNRAFLNAVGDALNRQLLSDPGYRWRDDQLAFYALPRAGVTTDYASGNQSRCGGNPWPGVDVSAETGFADVIGVLHTRPQRDCAGLGTESAGAGARQHFSANGGEPRTIQHELGHALFGLGDEYTEATASRQAPGGMPHVGLECGPCCTDRPGDIGCLPGQPRCGEPYDPRCFVAGPFCPPIGSSCERPNVFASEAECHAAAVLVHPGVELPSVPGDCRRLCAGDCPCSDPSMVVWILDRRVPAVPMPAPDDDVMGRPDGDTPTEHNGPACEACMETRFCIRWEEGRGVSPAMARASCLAP